MDKMIDLSNFNNGDYPKTLSQLDIWPRNKEQILIEMVNVAKQKHVTSSAFQKSFKVKFSYSTLTNRLKARGWVQDWHKPSFTNSSAPDKINNLSSNNRDSKNNTKILLLTDLNKEDKTRMSLSVNKELQEKWQVFRAEKCTKNDYIRALNEDALLEYMKVHKDTTFKFKLE